MARDYAKGNYSPPNGRKRKRPKKSSSAAPKRKKGATKKTASRPPVLFVAFLIAGVLLGMFIAGLMYLGNHPSITVESTTTEQTKIVNKNKTPHRTKHVHVSTNPHFDFYTILQNQTVDNPQVAKTAEKPAQIKNDIEYILQVASVRNSKDADRLRAQLILLGYNVFITQSHSGKIAWHRVNIGPFKQRQNAEDIRDELRKKHVNSLLLKKRV